MVTFLNGGNRLLGESASNAIILLKSAFSTEGWQISNEGTDSFTANNGIMHFDFSIKQNIERVLPDSGASFTRAFKDQEEPKYDLTGSDWLNIVGHDGQNNYSKPYYNLSILDEQSRLFAAIGPISFAICIGNLASEFAWDCVYGGMLDDAQDADAWGVGYADCRLRLHQIYRAKYDNSYWHMQGSVFSTISANESNNSAINNATDVFSSGNNAYNAPIAGLLDYFSTFSEQFLNSGSIGILDSSQDIGNIRYGCVYGAIHDCAILMPAFYLEGTAFANYGSAGTSGNSPLLYYRGTLPFLYSGGLSLLAGLIVERQNGQKFISTGNYFKLCMLCQ